MRISIITPSYEQGDFVQETIESVHANAHNRVEHIVVDGGSTDESKSIIKQHANLLAWWCSEKDEGQSHAINKGLKHVTGEVFNWLNSDDLLTPNAVDIVANAFQNDKALLALCGRLVHRTEEGDTVFEEQTDASVPMNFFINHVVSQPATWFRMSVIEAIGGVESKLKYVMDYELWLQFVFRYGTDSIKQIKEPLAIFRLHENSKTTTAHAAFIDEMASVLVGLCSSTDNEDLEKILALGYKITTGLRSIPVKQKEHATLVRRMVLHFLFKWNGTIHNAQQFLMMKTLIKGLDPVELKEDAFCRKRYNHLLSTLAVPNWPMFRVKRKLGF